MGAVFSGAHISDPGFEVKRDPEDPRAGADRLAAAAEKRDRKRRDKLAQWLARQSPTENNLAAQRLAAQEARFDAGTPIADPEPNEFSHPDL